MRIKLVKGKPRRLVDWSELDEMIPKLRGDNHLVVHPNGGISPAKFAQRIRVKYDGISVQVRGKSVVVTLA